MPTDEALVLLRITLIFRVSQDRNGTGSRHPELSIRLWGGSSGTGKTMELFYYATKGMQFEDIHYYVKFRFLCMILIENKKKSI